MNDTDKDAVAERLSDMWKRLEEEARAELRQEGMDTDELTFRYGVYARYIGQLESFDTPLDNGEVHTASDLDNIIAEFEKSYAKIFPEGARFPESGYSITEVYLQAIAPKPKPVLHKYEMAGEKPSDAAFVETRKAYHEGEWMDFSVWQMEELKSGNIIKGPAIIRDPMTTVVVPPEKSIELDEYLILHYR
jgi:N-methylhydantoinase A